MSSSINFTDNVLKSFKNITKEIEKGSSEHDVWYGFVKYFVEAVLRSPEDLGDARHMRNIAEGYLW